MRPTAIVAWPKPKKKDDGRSFSGSSTRLCSGELSFKKKKKEEENKNKERKKGIKKQNEMKRCLISPDFPGKSHEQKNLADSEMGIAKSQTRLK